MNEDRIDRLIEEIADLRRVEQRLDDHLLLCEERERGHREAKRQSRTFMFWALGGIFTGFLALAGLMYEMNQDLTDKVERLQFYIIPNHLHVPDVP